MNLIPNLKTCNHYYFNSYLRQNFIVCPKQYMQHVREHSISRPNSVSTVPGWVDTTNMLLSFNLLFIKYICITYKYINLQRDSISITFMLKYIRQGATSDLKYKSECRPRHNRQSLFFIFSFLLHGHMSREAIIYLYIKSCFSRASICISYSGSETAVLCFSEGIAIFSIRFIILYL